MSSQLPPAAPTTAGRICLVDPLVVSSWCSELKCTEPELRAAVYAVGSDPEQIRAYFHRSVQEKISMGVQQVMSGKL